MNSSKMTKPWVIYRCWAGQASTLVPQPTKHSFWTRHSAERFANDLTVAMSATGTWFEVRHAGVDHDER